MGGDKKMKTRTDCTRPGNSWRRVAPHAWLVPALVLVLGAGCVEVKDELTINADGSGTVRIETVTHAPGGYMTGGFGPMGPMESLVYPPADSRQARALFPGDDFTVKVRRNRAAKGASGVTVRVTFKDINTLIESPYGRAHSLSLQLEGDDLVLKARSGLQAAARIDAFLNTDEKLPAPVNLKSLAKKHKDLALDFKISLPATASVEGGGATAEGSTVTWAVDLSEAEDAAAAADAVERLDGVITARCPAAGIEFKPVKVARLDLSPFKDLEEGKIAEAAGIDAEKIRAAAKFVPILLHVTRSFDLAGSGHYERNSATLQGVVIVPRDLAPARWGESTLTKAEDDQGNDLLPTEDERYGPGWSSMHGPMYYEHADEDEDDEDDEADVTHYVSLSMQVPSIDADTIAHIKGSVEMCYTAAEYLVRIENAVPKNAIIEGKLEQYYRYMSGSDGATPISSPSLEKLGVQLTLNRASRVKGLVILQMGMKTDNAVVSGVHVFDAKGRPWPTLLTGSLFGFGGGDDSLQTVVVGAPEGPLSLALLVRAGGPSVKVPIELADVPITPSEAESAGADAVEKTPPEN